MAISNATTWAGSWPILWRWLRSILSSRRSSTGGTVAPIPPSVFLTPELWGVGSTGPWLHDDRAGTLAEAILLHGEDSPPAVGQAGRSEGQESRDAFKKLAADDQTAIVAFLKSLVAFSKEPKR